MRRRRQSLRGMLLATAALLGIGLSSEPEFVTTTLPGWWAALVVHQPDYDPERPLAPRFGTTTMAASGGRIVYASAVIRGEGTVRADAWVLRAAKA